MSDEKLLDVLSTTNDEGVPHLGTCTMVIGDGTMKVEFRNGRAKVPEAWAALVARHPHVEIPALASEEAANDDTVDYESLPLVALEALAAQRDLKVGGKVTKSKLVAALEQADEDADGDENPSETSEEARASRPENAPALSAEALELAREHLVEEGEEVPDIEVADSDSAPEDEVAKVRDGFEAATAEGGARCQAAKADGAQCANAAVDGSRACRLAKHQDQLAD